MSAATALYGAKALVAAVGSWSLPAKFLFSAIVGAVAGSGALGVLVEYATHRYCLAYGFRPPVEGIPYLRTSVVAASFVLLTTGAALGAFVLWLFSRRRVPSTTVAPAPSTPKEALVVMFVAVVATLAPVAFGVFDGTPSAPRPQWLNAYYGTLGAMFGAGLLGLTAARPRLIWWVSLGSIALYYLAAITMLFTPTAYASMLRSTGFGGGTPVQIQVDQGSDAPVLHVAGYLMLRTSAALVIYADTSRRFHEVSLNRIVQVSYDSTALDAERFVLPQRR